MTVDNLFTIARLEGIVQHYAWGGYDYIPALLGIKNDDKPNAELWLGAHAKAPSLAYIQNTPVKLDAHIRDNAAILGDRVVDKFGATLPYLLKVLDARDMLSIQVHPSKQKAEAGFAKEQQAGVPLDAPHRSYKDDNHKPEVQVALTDFWMLHSFRPVEEIEHFLKRTAEFHSLAPIFEQEGIEGLYKKIMRAPQDEIDTLLNPLIQRLQTENPQDMDTPDYWALKAAHVFPLPDGHRDRGIFSIYLLNLLHLKPGQATFQDAGELHAYLYGTNIELMANSDNVLRGGLTPKHVDVEALLKTVQFRCGAPKILTGENRSEYERVYATPAPDFELSRIEIKSGDACIVEKASGAEIYVMLNGDVTVANEGTDLSLIKGDAFWVSANAAIKITARSNAVLFKAAVPL